MAKNQRLEFVGIVEHLGKTPSYDYCSLNIKTGVLGGFANVETTGRMVADQFGRNFRKRITYEPPPGVDIRGTERGTTPKMYHGLSPLEQDRFEKSVLKELKGKK